MCQVRDDNPVQHGAIAIRGLDWVQLRSLAPGMVAEAGWLSLSGLRQIRGYTSMVRLCPEAWLPYFRERFDGRLH